MRRSKRIGTAQKTKITIHAASGADEIPSLELEGSWAQTLEPDGIETLEKYILPPYLLLCRWFGGKSRYINSVKVKDVIRSGKQPDAFTMLILNVRYASGGPESYLLPLAYTEDVEWLRGYPGSVICKMSVNGKGGFLYDAAYDAGFQRFLLALIVNTEKIKTSHGEIAGAPNQDYKPILQEKRLELPSRVLKVEQSNTSIIYKDVYFLKLLRKLAGGISPEREMTGYLTKLGSFHHIPAFAGYIQYRPASSESVDLCLLQAYVANQGDAWAYILKQVKSYFESVLSTTKKPKSPAPRGGAARAGRARAGDLIDGPYLDLIRLLGKRTAQMHLSLASGTEDPNFKPESFSKAYQRSLYSAMISQARQVMRLLRKSVSKLPSQVQGEAASILAMEKKIYSRFAGIFKKKFSAKKIRIHGDYHLGQVLFTGEDFVIMDFEGEPARPASERRLKRSALRDVAGMMRSFHYAAYGALFLDRSMREADVSNLDSAADLWSSTVADLFTRAYFETVGKADFLPKDREDLNALLQVYLLNKAIYELGYELNNRPNWVLIPLRGIKHILETPEKT